AKNLLILALGALLGLIISIYYAMNIWIPEKGMEAGLGIIAVVPIMITLFAIMGIVFGAVSAFIAYHVIKLFLRILK
ncbi:MAG: hypothetical protein PHG04_01690, partial [Candidatus Nanoarchaeia archaeon]|nr:hypothetical protein [Candidatus Nanoarchaeia archaeon]